MQPQTSHERHWGPANGNRHRLSMPVWEPEQGKGGGVSLWGVSQGPVLERECHPGLGVLEGHLTISEISLVLLPLRLWKSSMDLYLCPETEEMILMATWTPANGPQCP